MANNRFLEPMFVDTVSTATDPLVPPGILASIERIGVQTPNVGAAFELRTNGMSGPLLFQWVSTASNLNAMVEVPIRTTNGLWVSALGAGVVARLYGHVEGG